MRLANRFLLFVTAALALSQWPANARAQGLTVPKVRDTNVGYIDPAIPGDVFRFRYDSSYENNRPTRADFFWAPGGRFGPGPSIPEKSVDYQDLITYVEALLTETASVFVDVPVRFLNPELNPNTAGFSDLNFGVKQALIAREDLFASFQFRTYVPSGDFRRGLGNGHVSLEPAFLVYLPLDDRWGLEGEIRDWIPLTNNDFAGNIIRYGVGLHYDLIRSDDFRMTPVAEFVGWSVLDGKVAVRQSPDLVEVQDAAGNTIVNVKVGLRTKIGSRMDLYGGYGRALTGDVWYKNTFRLELRFFY